MKHNWEYKRLGDVCEIRPGQRIVSKDTLPGEYFVYGGGGATFTTANYNRENCMIISRFAMSSCCVRFIKGKFFLNDSGLSVHSLTPLLDQAFLDKYLWSNQSLIYSFGRGAAQKNLNMKSFSDLILPVPPIAVQRHIVAELDKINEIIADCKEAICNLDSLAQSLFYDYFGDPITNPKGWEVKSFKQVLSKIGSGATPRGGEEAYLGGNISLIRSLNIYNNFFKYEGLAKIDENQAYELRNVEVAEGDVLLNITGASVARCFIVPQEILPARVNQHVAILRPIQNHISSIFLHKLIIVEAFQNHLLRLARIKNATREALPKAILENIKIPLPPLSLQEKFASRIGQIEQQKKDLTETIANMQTLLDSRMDYWFN